MNSKNIIALTLCLILVFYQPGSFITFPKYLFDKSQAQLVFELINKNKLYSFI